MSSSAPVSLMSATKSRSQSVIVGVSAIQYPNRPVKILVGFTPGTAPDLAARILADRFSEVWGTPFVVENVPGAGSNIGAKRTFMRKTRPKLVNDHERTKSSIGSRRSSQRLIQANIEGRTFATQ